MTCSFLGDRIDGKDCHLSGSVTSRRHTVEVFDSQKLALLGLLCSEFGVEFRFAYAPSASDGGHSVVNSRRIAMAWLGVVVALILIGVVFIDAFEAMILPRR